MREYYQLPPLKTETVKYIAFDKRTIPVDLYTDGLWRDREGTVWGFADEGYSSPDADNRAGFWIFSIPKGHPANDAAKPHDYAYSSRAYQAFHSRKEADEHLLRLTKQIPSEEKSLLPYIFYRLSRIFGWFFWENGKTR